MWYEERLDIEPCEKCGRCCTCRRTVWLPLAGGHSRDGELLKIAPSDAVWTKDHALLAVQFAKFVYESTPATFYRELRAAFGHPEAYEEHWG